LGAQSLLITIPGIGGQIPSEVAAAHRSKYIVNEYFFLAFTSGKGYVFSLIVKFKMNNHRAGAKNLVERRGRDN